MRAIYLMGTSVYLRAMVESDKECAIAWFNTRLPMSGFGHVFPVDGTRATVVLKEENRGVWPGGRHRYAIVRNANEQVVGALVEESAHPVVAHIGVQMAPSLADADALRAEALRLVVPWLRDERQFRLVRMSIPSDETQTIRAAEAVGMTRGATLRRHVARPGDRVDLLMYEALNPNWVGTDA
jgi:RimJ/RimL family protein N-acetyltransferase